MSNDNKKKSLQSMFWLWVFLTIVGIAISLWAPAHWMPHAMSDNQKLSITTVVIFSVAAAPVAAGIYAAVLYALRNWTYRGDNPPAAGPKVRENATLVISWVSVSLVLTVFVLIWGLGALAVDNSSASTDPLVVNVTGQQWLWSFSYPGTNVSTPELYLPLNREVDFRITSKDVTHGFWVVNMGVQVDANPGTITTIHTTPNKLGTFDIRCEQFCGLNHAFMVTQGKVVTDQQFNSWLSSEQAQGA